MAEEVTPSRRSGRQTRPNTRYSNDALEGWENFSSDSDMGDDVMIDESEGDDFDYGQVYDQEADDEDGLELSEDDDLEPERDASRSEDEEIDLSSAIDDIYETTDHNVDVIPDTLKPVSRTSRVIAQSRRTTDTDKNLHSQGVLYISKNSAKHFLAAYTFGRTKHDIEIFLKTIKKWFPRITLPSRQADEQGVGGMAPSYFMPRDVMDCNNDGASWFLRYQICDVVDQDSTTQTDVNNSIHLIAGSISEGRPLSLSPQESAPLPNLWKSESDHNANENSSSAMSSTRKGWILNIGRPIHCLDWAPDHDGFSQYLAVSTYLKNSSSLEISEPNRRNSYIPTNPTVDTIQIWHFEGCATNVTDSWSIDCSKKPLLSNVLIFKHGPVIDLKWCPKYQNNSQTEISFEPNLGLLAVLTGDGAVRVYNVPCSSSIGTTEYQEYPVAAFTTYPPHTICTCLTWISPTMLAAGCTNGYVAAWDLQRVFASNKRAENATPFFFQQIHVEQIVTITSCRPSRPNFIVTTCIAGHLRVTNLRSPTTDIVEGLRSRLPIRSVAWHEQSQTAVSADDFQTLRCNPIRQFDRQIVFVRMISTLSCLASSLLHSSTLIGSGNGSVSVVNPLRKVTPTRDRERAFRQEWFRHEWRREPPRMKNGEDHREASNDTRRQQIKSTATVKLSTGFIVEDLSESSRLDAEERHEEGRYPFPSQLKLNGLISKDESNPVTVYPEAAKVNSLAWNPNLCAGGWAAAGMGSGLLWIEDLCVD